LNPRGFQKKAPCWPEMDSIWENLVEQLTTVRVSVNAQARRRERSGSRRGRRRSGRGWRALPLGLGVAEDCRAPLKFDPRARRITKKLIASFIGKVNESNPYLQFRATPGRSTSL
jgi:hypothetical protein